MRMRIYAYKLRMRWTLISERYCMAGLHMDDRFHTAKVSVIPQIQGITKL